MLCALYSIQGNSLHRKQIVDAIQEELAKQKGEVAEYSVNAWSTQLVGEWLAKRAFAGVDVAVFTDHGIDGSLLLQLNDENLSDGLGMGNDLQRKKFLSAVDKLRSPPYVPILVPNLFANALVRQPISTFVTNGTAWSRQPPPPPHHLLNSV